MQNDAGGSAVLRITPCELNAMILADAKRLNTALLKKVGKHLLGKLTKEKSRVILKDIEEFFSDEVHAMSNAEMPKMGVSLHKVPPSGLIIKLLIENSDGSFMPIGIVGLVALVYQKAFGGQEYE